MKYLIFFTLTALICWQGLSQSIHDTVAVYNTTPSRPGTQVLKIPLDFDAAVLPFDIQKTMKGQTVERIDLVYTRYKESESFDQHALNNRRKKNLIKKLPELKDPVIQWNAYGQSSGTDNAAARALFHGFVVYYRPSPTVESMKKELAFIDLMLEEGLSMEEATRKTFGSPTEKVLGDVHTSPAVAAAPAYTVGTSVMSSGPVATGEIDAECLIQMIGKIDLTVAGMEDFIDSLLLEGFVQINHSSSDAITSDPKQVIHYSYAATKLHPNCASKYPHGLPAPMMSTTMVPLYMPSYDDTSYDVVKATFERHPQWKNTQVIIDVTGSMAPYIAKTFAWVKDTQDKDLVDAFIFFNDGDGKMDRQKRVGSVGGIYSTKNSSYQKVKKTMSTTMLNRGGGDCPENNIEAVLHGMKKYPDCDEIVMVADNFATPRDLALLSRVDRPIHIILCGAQAGINLAYVQAAFRTGGSIHTIEEDMEMRNIKPGETFQIGQNHFTLVDGEIMVAQHKL